MRTTQKQFELFKKECRKWIDRFELSGWQIDFYLRDIDSSQAQVQRDYMSCIANVNFHTEITKSPDETWEELINDTAKHEMIHILLSNLVLLAGSRYVTTDEIEKAEEELVVRLGKIIL